MLLFDLDRKPMIYRNLKLPYKLPPINKPIAVTELPLPGFLEQTLAIALHKAMSSVGLLRPKLPFITIKQSVLIYIGLHLKGNNQFN